MHTCLSFAKVFLVKKNYIFPFDLRAQTELVPWTCLSLQASE